MISSNQISVIIQGPIANGKAGTSYTCKSIRKYLPEAQIILSTWKGENVSGLDYDLLVLSDPPKANKIMMPDFKNVIKLNTINHQIISTHNGLSKSTKKFSLKIRSDMYLINTGFLRFFQYYNSDPVSKSEFLVFEKRICTLPTFWSKSKPFYPFNLCDWIQFGLTSDLNRLFSIPLEDTFSLSVRKGEQYPRVSDNLGAEQYLWVTFLRSNGKNIFLKNAFDVSKGNDILSDKYLAYNLIPLQSKLFGVKSQKYDSGYIAPTWKTTNMISFRQWERLYKKYVDPKYIIKPKFSNLVEKILHSIYLFYINIFHRN